MSRFKVGDRVHHHFYGRGTIKALDNSLIPYFVEFDSEHENADEPNIIKAEEM